MQRAISALALLAVLAAPAPAAAETQLGVLGAVVTGSHVGSENPDPVSGVVPGALLELTQRWQRVRLHLEGIPRVAARGSNSGAFGTSTASLSLLNATALVDLDARGRVRAGAGFQLVNLSNSNGSNGDTNFARITSPRYEVASTLPLAKAHFIELSLALLPHVNGVLHIVNSAGIAQPSKPESGAEVDYAAGFGWRRGAVEYVAGLRGLSYHTRNVVTGDLVDRNVGGGVTFEARLRTGR